VFKDPFLSRLAAGYDPAKAAALFARFARNGTWQTPTLTALEQVWNARSKDRTDAEKVAAQKVLATYEVMLRGMRDAGLRLLAGTDFESEDGIALHDELARLVAAGLSPMEALQTATRHPAEFLGRLRTEGTIETGKRADLVLLTANPLEQIGNVRRVANVVLGGRVVRP
jgi:imidazolonepropionase-like amidohydrolase